MVIHLGFYCFYVFSKSYVLSVFYVQTVSATGPLNFPEEINEVFIKLYIYLMMHRWRATQKKRVGAKLYKQSQTQGVGLYMDEEIKPEEESNMR